MIAAPVSLDAFIVHRADGIFAICHCPQPQGSEHRAYTATYADADPDAHDGLDFGLGGSVDDAIDALIEHFRQEA